MNLFFCLLFPSFFGPFFSLVVEFLHDPREVASWASDIVRFRFDGKREDPILIDCVANELHSIPIETVFTVPVRAPAATMMC